MKCRAGLLALLAALGGTRAPAGSYMSQVFAPPTPDGARWGAYTAPSVPSLVGPWGQPVPVAAPYNASPTPGRDAAQAMLSQSMPLELVMQTGRGSGVLPVQACGPNGCPAPGLAPPGIGGPGNLISPPGIAPLPPGLPPGLRPPGAVAAVGALVNPNAPPFAVQRTEIRFVGPAGMKISWYTPNADGKPGFGTQYLEAPARYNFLQASIYRLKLSDIPNHPGVELYPTLEVVPSKARTATFLAHSAVPVSFTEEDFEQVAAGNFVVKVVYLPDPQFQDLAATGPDEVVSSRLEPGVDPIIEAQRRGCILLVVRLGNIDLEAPNTPAMDAPNPFCPPGGPPPQAVPGMPPAGPQGPFVPGMMPSRRPDAPAPTMPVPPANRGPVPGVPAILPPGATPAGRSVGSAEQSGYPIGGSVPRARPTLAELAGQTPPTYLPGAGPGSSR